MTDRKSFVSKYRLKELSFLLVLLLPFFQPVTALPATIITSWIIAWRVAVLGAPGWVVRCCRYLLPFILLAVYVAAGLFAVQYVHRATIASWRWAPVVLFILVGVAGSALIVWRNRLTAGEDKGIRPLSQGILWAVCLSLSGLAFFANWDKEVIRFEMYTSLSPQTIDRLPETDLDSMRLLPQQVAAGYAASLNDEAMFDVGTPHIAPCDSSGKTCWQSPIVLEGFDQGIYYDLFFETVIDVAMIDATTGVKNAWKLGKTFVLGPHSWPVKMAFAARHPFSQAKNPLWVRETDGDVVALIPYVSLRPTWTGTMIPYLAGVARLNRFGILTDMSVSTATRLYPDVPFFPHDLAREYAEIYADWHGGLWGVSVSKMNRLKISDPPKNDHSEHYNPAPYIQRYEGIGYQEVVGLEPPGARSGALVEILFFDAGNGHARVYEPESIQGAELRSPGQSMDVSRQSDADAGLYNVERVEPRFIFHNNNVYYVVGIVDKEHSAMNGGHAYVRSVIIDARSNLSERFFSLDDLKAILKKLDKGGTLTPGLGSTPHAKEGEPVPAPASSM